MTKDPATSADDVHTAANSPYRTRMIPGAPTSAQIDQLQADIVNAVTDEPATAAYWMTTVDLANWMATRGYSA
ncbi:hypothetical protein ABT214_02290 [Micromonospora purpureochromogenes]